LVIFSEGERGLYMLHDNEYLSSITL